MIDVTHRTHRHRQRDADSRCQFKLVDGWLSTVLWNLRSTVRPQYNALSISRWTGPWLLDALYFRVTVLRAKPVEESMPTTGDLKLPQ